VASSSVASLRRRSVQVIRDGQSREGGYVASPTFAQYGFSWLRDGSFIADAMSRVGEIASAEAFFDWVARIVTAGRGFDARYRLAGERDGSGWPHRQHDGYGGGEWLLLTALLGLADPARARDCLDWIAAHERAAGLPEQSPPESYEPWVEKWGLPPSPLLWSHAMFLTLAHALDN